MLTSRRRHTTRTILRAERINVRADYGDVEPLCSAGHPQVSSPRRRDRVTPANAAEYWVPAFALGCAHIFKTRSRRIFRDALPFTHSPRGGEGGMRGLRQCDTELS